MNQAIIRTAEQEEYVHPDHKLFFMRDVVTAAINPHLSLHRGRIEPDGEIIAHIHEHCETIYILAGEVICILDGEETTLGAGNCIVAPPQVERGFKNSGDIPVELLIVFTPPRR